MKIFRLLFLLSFPLFMLNSQEITFNKVAPLLGERIDKAIEIFGAPNTITCPTPEQELKLTWIGWDKFAFGVDENGTNISRINFFLSNYDNFMLDGLDFTKTNKSEIIKKYGNPSEDYTEEYMYWDRKDYLLDVWFNEGNKPEEVGIRFIFKYKDSKASIKDLSELLYTRLNNIFKLVGTPGRVVCPTENPALKDCSLYWDKFSVSISNKIAIGVHVFYFEQWNEVKFKGVDFKTANKDKIISILGNKFKEYPEHKLLTWTFEDYNLDVYFDNLGKPVEFAFSQK